MKDYKSKKKLESSADNLIEELKTPMIELNNMYIMYGAVHNGTMTVYKYRNKKWKWYDKSERTLAINIKAWKTYQTCDSFKTYINAKLEEFETTGMMNFDIYYDFAEFVKICEKVFFYKNDSEAIIACDSKLSDNKKILVAQLPSGKIVMELYRENENKIMIISVSHNYGRTMSYRYEVINGRPTNIENGSDSMLLMATNNYMRHMIVTFFCYFTSVLINNAIVDFMRGEIKYDPVEDLEDDTEEIGWTKLDDLSWQDVEFLTWYTEHEDDPDVKKALNENRTIYYKL